VREFVVAQRKDEGRQRELATVAWYTATLTRAKKIPSLRELLRKRGQQTQEEQAQVWRRAAQAFGLKVSRHDPRAVRIVRPQKHG
jgi:hypothetical protein